MKDSFIFIWQHARRYRKIIIKLFVFVVLFEVIALISPYISGLIIDNFFQGIDFKYVAILIATAFGLSMISNVLYIFKERVDYNQFYFDFTRDIWNQGAKKLLSLSVGQHTSKNSGVKDTIMSKGVSSIKDLTRVFVYDFLSTSIKSVVTLTALFLIDWQIGLICLVAFSLMIVLQWFLVSSYMPSFKESEKLGQAVNKSNWEILRNIFLIKNNGREEYGQQFIDENIQKRNSFEKKVWVGFVSRLIASGGIVIFATSLVMLVAAWKISTGRLSPGMFVVVSMWSAIFFSGVKVFQFIYRMTATSLPAIREYKELLEIKPDITIPANPIRPKVWNGEVEFKNVFFAYQDEEGGKNVLNEISFHVRPGEFMGIVGRSGSGKSTLTKLLLRNYDPNKGSILIDGHNLKKLDLSHYLHNVGYVEQSTQLFDTTIGENLSFVTDRELSEEDLKTALKQAGLLEFVEGLPNGLNTKIGEQGIKLSGGQRQRLAIARALVKKPSILILDEATASLDTEKEREIQEAIDNLANENISATKIVIAHRLSTIINADRIFVFDKGKIVATGTHKELLETSDIYQTLYNLQHSHTLEGVDSKIA